MKGNGTAAERHTGTTERVSGVFLAAEFVILFVGGPLAVAWWMPKRFLIPSIMAFGFLCLVLLLRDATFDRRQLWNWGRVRAELPRMLLLIGAAVMVVTGLVLAFKPELVLSLVRDNPWLWVAIMLGYPLASVYPQEVVYRAFIFHRYKPLFQSEVVLMTVSALAFGYAHIVMWNWIAIGATLIGGAIFAWTYSRTRSVAATALEHALYGCFMFTVGMGRFFYGGTLGA